MRTGRRGRPLRPPPRLPHHLPLASPMEPVWLAAESEVDWVVSLYVLGVRSVRGRTWGVVVESHGKRREDEIIRHAVNCTGVPAAGSSVAPPLNELSAWHTMQRRGALITLDNTTAVMYPGVE